MTPKYYVDQYVFGEKTNLFADLYEAIRVGFLACKPAPIPTAWPQFGLLATTTEWTNWWVGYDYTFKDGTKGGMFCEARFHDPRLAFEWAELMQKRTVGDRSYFVRFMWSRDPSNKGGGGVELERFPARWLSDKKKAWERAEKQRRAKESRCLAHT